MAKRGESLIELKRKMGMNLSDAQKLAINEKYGEGEIEDDYFDEIINVALPNYAQNQKKSLQDDFDLRLGKLKDKIGEGRFNKIQKKSGFDKIDALDTELGEYLAELRTAKRDDDPEAIRIANAKIQELNQSIFNLQTQFEGFVSPDDHKKEVNKHKKRAHDSGVRENVRRMNDVPDAFKEGYGLTGLLQGYHDKLEEMGLQIDYDTNKILQKDGTELFEKGKALTPEILLDKVVNPIRKIGGEAPAPLPLGGRGEAGFSEPFMAGLSLRK